MLQIEQPTPPGALLGLRGYLTIPVPITELLGGRYGGFWVKYEEGSPKGLVALCR